MLELLPAKRLAEEQVRNGKPETSAETVRSDKRGQHRHGVGSEIKNKEQRSAICPDQAAVRT
uniref:Uncharacterized protein n=1 Tax=Fagus sylvatica TaxID=28930 RepID=A0A2N9EXT1_FAGSY